MRASLVLSLIVSSGVLTTGCQTDILFHVPESGLIQRLRCGEARTLSLPTRDNSHAQWSPDGTLVVYRGQDRNGPALFVTDSRGRAPRNLTEGNVAVPAHDFVWSPDSAWILYTAFNPTGTFAIYRVNVSGAPVPQALTPLSLDSIHPGVSPDGREFVYASNHPRDRATFDLYVSRVNGDNRRALVETPGVNDFLPSWGPDGRIAFVRDRRVMLRQADGELVDLDSYAGTVPALPRVDPDRLAWSGDASFIAYSGGGGKIHVAGSRAPFGWRCVTCDPDVGLHIDGSPRWYRGDRSLVYNRPVGRLPPTGSPTGVFAIGVDGSDERLLVRGGSRPDPRKRIFSFCF